MQLLVKLNSVLRPLLFLVVATSYALGYYWSDLVASGFTDIPAHHIVFTDVTVLSVTVLFLVSLGAHFMNDAVDSTDTDRYGAVKDHVNIVYTMKIDPGRLLRAGIALFAAAALPASMLHSWVPLLVAAGLAVSYMYSVRPRLKGRPVLDVVFNTLGLFMVPFVSGMIVAGGPVDTCALLAFFLIASGMYIVTAYHDVEADSAAGLRTTAVVLGEYSLPAASALHLLGWIIFLAIYTPPIHIAAYSAVPAAAYMAAYIWPRKTWSVIKTFFIAMYTVGALLAASIIM